MAAMGWVGAVECTVAAAAAAAAEAQDSLRLKLQALGFRPEVHRAAASKVLRNHSRFPAQEVEAALLQG